MITKVQYYLGIAKAVAARANCQGRKVGAVLVRGDRIVSTGYNGTPAGVPNCLDGGCQRCANRAEYPSGTNYDLCICVHAEANALLSAARFGIATEGATLFATHQACFACSKELIQAAVEKAYFLEEWVPNQDVEHNFWLLQGRLQAEKHELPALWYEDQVLSELADEQTDLSGPARPNG
jgi:dCMP deaminase